MQLSLIFIRHGLTAGNEQRRYVGQGDDQPLSEKGREQLRAWQAGRRYPPADALYVSPLLRCRETAQILYPMLAPVILPSLIELDMGAFEGKTYDQLKDDPAYRRWIDTRGMSAPPGGESGEEFAARLRRRARAYRGGRPALRDPAGSRCHAWRLHHDPVPAARFPVRGGHVRVYHPERRRLYGGARHRPDDA